jgi:hypothetical protein
MMQNVAWVVPPDNPESMSSYRYNAFIPARELGGQVLFFDRGDADAFLDQYSLDAIIICKPVILTSAEAISHPLVDLAIACNRRHIALCFHICDWHFDIPIYRKLSELADLIVVQTRPIAAAVWEHYGRQPAIIEEPYEGPRGKPRFKPKKILNLLWYGHVSNLDTLVVGLAQLHRLSCTFKLSIVTNKQSDARAAFDSVERPPYLVERAIIPFTLERQWRELQGADMVIIPGFFAKEKNVKGHNRLVQSLHAGRLAAVFPLPQYQELADYCLCHEDIAYSIQMALRDPLNAIKRVRAGQQYIDGRFSPAAVASRWRREITNLLVGRNRSAVT